MAFMYWCNISLIFEFIEGIFCYICLEFSHLFTKVVAASQSALKFVSDIYANHWNFRIFEPCCLFVSCLAIVIPCCSGCETLYCMYVIGHRVRRSTRSLTLTCQSLRTTSTSASGVICRRSLTNSSELSSLHETFSLATCVSVCVVYQLMIELRFLRRELCSARYMPWPCVCVCVCLSVSVTSRCSTKMA